MTDLIFRPAATANVRESWKLIPHSAWCAPSSVSGVVLLYGRTRSVIAASRYQPSCWATKNPGWSVFGVQSSASRTVAGCADADGTAEPEAEGDGPGPPQ